MARTVAPTTNNGSTGHIKSDFETHAGMIRKDIEALAKSVTAAGSVLAEDARANAGQKAADLRDASEKTVRELRAQLASLEQQVGGHVRERPLTALALAAGAGFLFAMLAARR